MSILLTFIIGILSILIGKYIFKRWFNHVTIYTASWGMYIILYELKLMRYIDLSSDFWFALVITFTGFISGVITFKVSKNNFEKESDDKKEYNFDQHVLFRNDANLLKLLILVFSIIGLITALLHWYVLINKFGSMANVLIQANIIYRMRVEGELTEVVPYLYIVAYCGTFLGAVYTAYKRKITLLALLPLVAVIIKDIASIGRAGIFLGFLLFVITFFLFHYALIQQTDKNGKHSYRGVIIAFIIIAIIAIGSATAVKTIRGTMESFKTSTSALNKLQSSAIITPSIYLYFSSNVGVFSKYLESEDEEAYFGQNTFLPIYNFLSRFDVVEHPGFYPKGYMIPMWTNSATYLRELHADFGVIGLFLIPFLLGLLTTYYWFRFYSRGNFFDFIILVYLYLIVGFSIFYMVTRSAAWVISLIILLVSFGVINYIESKKKISV